MTASRVFIVTVFAVLLAAEVNGSNNLGRLLTPEEGCGFPLDKLFLMQHQTTWPWIGTLLTYSNNRMLVTNCTTTLITSRHTLTSANCAKGHPLYVRLGETSENNTNLFDDYIIVLWVIHPHSKPAQLKNNLALIFLGRDVVFSDRIRPACLPPRESILSERVSEIYRLVRTTKVTYEDWEEWLDVSRTVAYEAKNYTQMETEYCELIYRVNLKDQTALCAQGDGESANQGDPFVVKVRGEDRTTPVYLIGLDAIRMRRMDPGIFLNIYPYVEWINNTINGKVPTTKNVQIFSGLPSDF